MHAFMKRWEFTEHDEHARVWWTWQMATSEGGTEKGSEGFRSYGEAVADAIRKGFHPRNDDWVVESKRTVVHFERGRAAARLPNGNGRSGDERPTGVYEKPTLVRR
jgi:hypothetical protein